VLARKQAKAIRREAIALLACPADFSPPLHRREAGDERDASRIVETMNSKMNPLGLNRSHATLKNYESVNPQHWLKNPGVGGILRLTTEARTRGPR